MVYSHLVILACANQNSLPEEKWQHGYIIYSHRPVNLVRLVAALALLDPYLRGAPPGLPFRWSVETLKGGLNFTLTACAIQIRGGMPHFL
jgi:hypothetical protein